MRVKMSDLEKIKDLLISEHPPEYKLEIATWVEYLRDKSGLDTYSSRLLAREREDALAEIQAAYFLETKLGCKQEEWQVPNLSSGAADFSFRDHDDLLCFCEVKRPSWKNQVVKSKGKQAQRLRGPRCKTEAYWGDPMVDIKDKIKSSYSQMDKDRPNVLIFMCDNLRIGHSPVGSPMMFTLALQEDNVEMALLKRYPFISSVLALHIRSEDGRINYAYEYRANPWASISVRIT
ncbi:MAG: hypothetical protein GF408_01570 [Candidatus Omnitrophica bacterium]|nr:hypothetical protein [Candidatus Omnitrophota bacterium]